MKIVSDNIKNALKQPTTQRKGRILVNGNYYEVYNVEYYADAYEDGNVIGNAIASQLDFDLPYIDKFNTFKYFDGVWTGNEYEYVDMGTFTVFDEQDEDEFNKHITAFDNLINFNKPFEEKGTYPKTLYEELQNVCQQANVELVNTSIPNGNFEVENNQFVNGETLKTVLKAICQISGNYGIIKEDKLVLQLTNDTDETILKNQHEPVVWKRKTYGINQVILQLGDVEGEYVIRQDEADIVENGVHKLVITNNPFAYTQDKRDTLIDALFNQVREFGYIPYEMNCEWLNYLEIGDKIIIDGIETTVLRIQGKSPKGLESFISAPGIIDSAVEYANNTNSIKNQITRTEIIVDKQNREITSVINTTEQLQKEINPTKDESGSNITIEDASNNPLTYLEIEGKSIQDGEPTPNAPVEIESVGYENLFNFENVIENANIDSAGMIVTGIYTINYAKVKPNTTYIITRPISHQFVITTTEAEPTLNTQGTTRIVTTAQSYIITTGDNQNYICIRHITSNENNEKLQIKEGSIAHSYIPFGKYGIEVKVTNGTDTNTKVLQLNEPLRSLSNGVKDKAYIKNNKLYVDRYVGSVILNGTENWEVQWNTEDCRGWRVNVNNLKQITNSSNNSNVLSNYFPVYSQNTLYAEKEYGISNRTNQSQIIVKNNNITSITDFKTWLSTNNVQVDYELATPITEEYGEFEMLKTLKGYNNISTTDKLLPIINLTYIRDTVIADYVENHVTELKLTENEIKASVESVSSSVDGLNTTINRVEEITNDNSQVINVISTNIDKTSGEVREVTTTTGFTFNKDGMTIDDGSGFKAEHTANGTYYKDGNSIVGQYTKDGSKQKDLELFGTYSYGKESINDTPMFVGQLYTDANDEQGFGHFYNGEG